MGYMGILLYVPKAIFYLLKVDYRVYGFRDGFRQYAFGFQRDWDSGAVGLRFMLSA